MALGIAALVSLNAFSKRIQKTVSQDTRNFLSADIQIKSYMPFDATVLNTSERLADKNGLTQEVQVLTSVVLSNGYVDNATLSAIEGVYPFYGVFKNSQNLNVENLKNEPSAMVDESWQKKGLKIGDKIKIGSQNFKIVSYIQEDAQMNSGFLSLGGRIIIHKQFLNSTALNLSTSRALYTLYVKTKMDPNLFRQEFRKQIADPHWRVVTPDRANNQVETVVSRLKSFLNLVALTALFLGSLGAFFMLRSHFFIKKDQWLTLRCLGLSHLSFASLIYFHSLLLALLAGILGTFFGLLIERLMSYFANEFYGVSLAKISIIPSYLLGISIAIFVTATSLWAPLKEILRWPVSNLLHTTYQPKKIHWKDYWPLFLAAIGVVVFFSSSINFSLYYFLFLLISTFSLILFSQLSLSLLLQLGVKFKNIYRHMFLRIARQPLQFRLLVLAMGLASFVLCVVEILGQTINSQLVFDDQRKLPNFYVLSVEEKDLLNIKALIPNSQSTPVMQARLKSFKGEEIVEVPSDVQEESERFLTREYTITKRSHLALDETLSSSPTLFGKAEKNLLRVSIEESFAKRVALKVGDHFQISLAGVVLESRVDSLRKVNWLNFHPNFFLVFAEEDLADLPMNYLVYSNVDKNIKEQLQKKIASQFPSSSTLDIDMVKQKIVNLMKRVSLAVESMALFTLISSLFVFLGIFLSRKQSLLAEISLLKCLGWPKTKLLILFSFEWAFSAFFSLMMGCSLALVAAYFICTKIFQLEFHFPNLSNYFLFIITISLLIGLGVMAYVSKVQMTLSGSLETSSTS
jgi:putative ABC transport system permease protein